MFEPVAPYLRVDWFMLRNVIVTQGCTYNKSWPNYPRNPGVENLQSPDNRIRHRTFRSRGTRRNSFARASYTTDRPDTRAGREEGKPYCARRLPDYMVDLLATAAAGLAVVLFGFGLLAMTEGSFAPAGASFLSASLVIYIRETYLVGG